MPTRPPIMHRAIAMGLTILLALVLAAALTLGGSSKRSRSPGTSSGGVSAVRFDGAALPAGTPPRDFTLTDQHGRRVALRSYRGQVTILAFLNSACGATCVLIAQQVRGALNELPRPVPVLIVSTDPAADTQASVRRFLARVSLSGHVRYLSGARSSLERVWRAYDAAPSGRGSATGKRSVAVVVLDRSGSERVLFELEQLTPESLAHDVRELL